MVPTLMTRRPPATRPGRRRAGRPPGPAEDQVIWVYAITDALSPRQLDGLTGVGGESVRPVTEAGLSAVVGSVDARAFGEHALASTLGGLDNIERVGRAHHQVIACAAATGGPVLPLRLATIHPDDNTVRALLARRHGEFAGMLDRFRNTVEWGMQIYGPAGPAEAVERAEDFADAIDSALSDIAVATRRQPGEDPQSTSRAEWMVRSGAYLLPADRAVEFTAVAHTLASGEYGVRADVNGPWPPYSFVDELEA